MAHQVLWLSEYNIERALLELFYKQNVEKYLFICALFNAGHIWLKFKMIPAELAKIWAVGGSVGTTWLDTL